MKERPIIFKGEMVRAILEGRKTQTRRLIKPQPYKDSKTVNLWCWGEDKDPAFTLPILLAASEKQMGEELIRYRHCPYGQAGDRLWVRETFYPCLDADQKLRGDCVYKTDQDSHIVHTGEWRPSRFMPRWASRITLEITEVKVKRIQDIAPEDCQSEGLVAITESRQPKVGEWASAYGRFPTPDWDAFQEHEENAIREGFINLWNSIHGKDAWERNNWVWVISFKKL